MKILRRRQAPFGALGHVLSEGPTELGAGRDRAVPAYERLQERSRRFVESAATSLLGGPKLLSGGPWESVDP